MHCPPQNNGYGLFITRGNNERLYTFWKHLNWQYTRLGTATLHEDPHSKNLLDTDYLDFIITLQINGTILKTPTTSY